MKQAGGIASIGLIEKFLKPYISVIAGTDAGSKLTKAEELGITVIDEQAMLALLGSN